MKLCLKTPIQKSIHTNKMAATNLKDLSTTNQKQQEVNNTLDNIENNDQPSVKQEAELYKKP